jgi:hypothetical protein
MLKRTVLRRTDEQRKPAWVQLPVDEKLKNRRKKQWLFQFSVHRRLPITVLSAASVERFSS